MVDRVLLLACGLCLGGTALAEEAPDEEAVGEAEFIEYLGLWAESDEEWLMYETLQAGDDSAEKEAETEDES